MFAGSILGNSSGFDSSAPLFKLQCNIAGGSPTAGALMALTAKLQVRQTQSLVITPQLMQAIRLLQMSSLELERFVAAELEQNPLLEEADNGAGQQDELGAETSEPEPGPVDAADVVEADPDNLDPDWNGFEAGPSIPSQSRDWTSGPLPDGEGRDLGEYLAGMESLAEHLDRQIEAAFAHSPTDRLIAFALLAGLDEAGYLSTAVTDIAAALGAPKSAVERVLGRCQEFEPTGVFAQGLAECLALQLAERNRLDPAMQALLAHLDRLAARDVAGLRALCRVDAEDLAEMIAEIRALDPKPGLRFAHAPVQMIVPDVFVRAGPDGGWIVELNDAMLPKLIVNRTYVAKLPARATEADRRYLSECVQKASWLEKSLDQRARTMLRVASEIVRRQEAFLRAGIAHLKPLNLRAVAEELGIHESTVSRAAANKYLGTPRGIFEFRYFFTASIPASAGGEAHSSEAVKHRIRKLILDESPEAILSDDTIVAILGREGVEIARRTVAKYRESMRIGSSVQRRREKRLRAAS